MEGTIHSSLIYLCFNILFQAMLKFVAVCEYLWMLNSQHLIHDRSKELELRQLLQSASLLHLFDPFASIFLPSLPSIFLQYIAACHLHPFACTCLLSGGTCNMQHVNPLIAPPSAQPCTPDRCLGRALQGPCTNPSPMKPSRMSKCNDKAARLKNRTCFSHTTYYNHQKASSWLHDAMQSSPSQIPDSCPDSCTGSKGSQGGLLFLPRASSTLSTC